MNRRTVMALIGGAAAARALLSSRAARAQDPGRIYRIGSIQSAPRDAPHQLAFFAELKRLGFIEGQNLTVDWPGYGIRVEQYEEHARALGRAKVDIILVGGDAAVRAAQQATAEIPILALTDDMVGQGFVRSLAMPGGNTTGVTILAAELDQKRQEILIEALPGIRRIAALVDSNITTPAHVQELEKAARARGVELSIHRASTPEGIAPAIEAAKTSGAQALNVLASALLFNNRSIIFDRVKALRLPAIYQWPEMAAGDGCIGYGPRIVQLYRDVMTRQVVRLLRGAKPAEIPVEQPTKFELVINLKIAKALGLELPTTLVARADEVIE
jgi:putative tryptophan/tyrosine transport system substrate-binding protein